MVDTLNHKRFSDLILEFVEGETPADRFVPRFIKLWNKARDAQRSQKQSWSEPFDEQLKAAFLGKRISAEEFSAQWTKLWGYRSENDVKFLDLIDRLFSACDVYRHAPRSDFEYDEDRLRAFVAETFSAYLLAVARGKGNEVGTR